MGETGDSGALPVYSRALWVALAIGAALPPASHHGSSSASLTLFPHHVPLSLSKSQTLYSHRSRPWLLREIEKQSTAFYMAYRSLRTERLSSWIRREWDGGRGGAGQPDC
jgi:hypothetical protein